MSLMTSFRSLPDSCNGNQPSQVMLDISTTHSHHLIENTSDQLIIELAGHPRKSIVRSAGGGEW